MAPDRQERRRIVVDGSNIATEGRTLPSLAQLDEAIRSFLEEYQGFSTTDVTVVVDASFGHRIDPSEVAAFEQAIDHGEMITPPAGAVGRGDGFILRIAEKSGALVLSNDSFQEFHAERPWLFEPGRLIGGKPVPGVGWVFTPRTPVRGVRSRSVTRSRRDGSSATEPAGATNGADGAATKAAGTKAAGTKAAGTKAAGTKAAGTKAAGTKAAGTKAAKATKATKATKAAKSATASTAASPEDDVESTMKPKSRKATSMAQGDRAAGSEDGAVKATKVAKGTKTDGAAKPAKAKKADGAAKPAKAKKADGAAEPAKAKKADGAAKPAKSSQLTATPPAAAAPTGSRGHPAPSALNDPVTFLTFVADHPVGSTLEGTVVSFTSHGAHVDVGGMLCHVPLRGLADPPPTRARQVLAKGETRPFVLVSLDAAHRRAELALPGVGPR